MTRHNRLLPFLAVMSSTGLVAPFAWSAIEARPEVKIPTVMFISPADFALKGLSVPATVPDALEKARQAANQQPGSNHAIVLHRGSKIAVIPQAFTQGSKAVLVHPEGKVASLVLTAETVAKLENDLSAGQIESAHKALFDGAKSAGSTLVVPDIPTLAENKQLAARVTTFLYRLHDLPNAQRWIDTADSTVTSFYSRREVADHEGKAAESGLINQLIVAGKFEVAAELAKGLAPDRYWGTGTDISQNGSSRPNYFLRAQDVDDIVASIVGLLGHAHNRRFADTAALAFELIRRLGRYYTERSDFLAPTSLYAADLVIHRIDAASEEIRRLIIRGEFKDAAAMVKAIAPDAYWQEGDRMPNNTGLYEKNEVDDLLQAMINSLQRHSPMPVMTFPQ